MIAEMAGASTASFVQAMLGHLISRKRGCIVVTSQAFVRLLYLEIDVERSIRCSAERSTSVVIDDIDMVIIVIVLIVDQGHSMIFMLLMCHSWAHSVRHGSHIFHISVSTENFAQNSSKFSEHD